jgi:hypothetical protein
MQLARTPTVSGVQQRAQHAAPRVRHEVRRSSTRLAFAAVPATIVAEQQEIALLAPLPTRVENAADDKT